MAAIGVRATIDDARASPSDDAERESAYALLQRGQALIKRRHHAQAAIVLERAAREEPRQGLDPRAARAGVPPLRPVRAGPRDVRGSCSRSIPSAHWAHFALAATLRKLGRRTRRGPTCASRSRSARPRSCTAAPSPGSRPAEPRRADAAWPAAGSPASRRRATRSTPAIVFASGSSPRSTIATASSNGSGRSSSRSSSSGARPPPWTGARSVARYRCISSLVNPGAV